MALRFGFVTACCLKCLFSFSFIFAFNDSDANLQPLFYFTEEPSGIVYGTRGDTICLRCSAFCAENGLVTITWRKDDRAITNTIRRYVLENGTFCIERLRGPNDEGIYECLARHALGTIVSPKVKLELTRMSSIIVDPVSVSAVEGESVRFQCLVSATPSSRIEWEKNGQLISTSDIHRVTVLEYLGVLQIVNVTVKDEGQYQCVVANHTSTPAALTVAPLTVGQQVAVVLLGRPKDQEVVLLQTIVFECFLTGLPAPTVTWTKQGSVLRKNARLFGSGNLEITGVDVSDAGVYVCSWTRRPDDEISSSQANVTVSVPPQLLPTESMLPYTLKRKEQIVRLTCRFSGRPVPRVMWLKNGQRLEQTSRIKIEPYELSISQSKASDAGMYQCRAENKVGMDQATTLLKFESNENSPWPPVGLVATMISGTSIRFSWRDPPRNKERNVSAYSVHISPTKGGQELQHVVPRGKQAGGSWEMENLRPYTNYTFYVIAYNMYGGSDHSRRLITLTADDVPVSFPLLQLVPLGTSSVRLQWKELTADQARGTVTEYRIMHRKHGTQTYEQVSLPPFRTEYVLKDLESNTKYDVMVAARTRAGYPSLVTSSLPWVTCTTKPYNQSGVPDAPEMNAFAIDDAAIFVNWTAGNQSVPILGYKLFCQISHSTQEREVEHQVTLGPDATWHLFSSLEPSTMYQLRLLAVSQRGESQASALTIRTNRLPSDGGHGYHTSSPSSFPVEAEAISSSAISLHWKKPAALASVIEYVVRYRHTNPIPLVESNGVIYKYLKSLTENLIVGDLDPFTMYEFSVEARGSQTVRSQMARCQTNEAVPSAPLDLDVTLMSSGAVHVQWNPPAKRNGIITKYLVLYTQNHDLPLEHWFKKVENGTLLLTTVLDLRSGDVYYFRVQAATSTGYGPPSDVAYISIGAATAGGLSDQHLGIVIGTSIGVTCIIICTCIIVLRNRCCPVPPVAMASAGAGVANGTVTSCHCHAVDCTAEFHVLHPSAEVDAHDNDRPLLANLGLVENSHCDTKGGNVPNGRNPRFLGQKCYSQSPIVSPKQSPENHCQAVPLLEVDGKAHHSEDILDLEGIDYEEEPDTEKVTVTHEGDSKASYSRQYGPPANHDRLLGGKLPSRKAEHLADGKISGEGKVEKVCVPEQNDNCVTHSHSDMQQWNGCSCENSSERCYSSQCNGHITNCSCQDENQGWSHKCYDDSQEVDGSISDNNDPDNCSHGDHKDNVTCKELGSECYACCHDNHNSDGDVLGCVGCCRNEV